MKKTFAFLLLLTSSVARATDIEAEIAVLRGVDKVTGHTATSKIIVGHPTTFNNMRLTVERCLKKPPEETPENAAYILIEEEKDNVYQVVFNGWMFSSNPALSAMEHPIFDIWLLSCESNRTDTETKDINPLPTDITPAPIIASEVKTDVFPRPVAEPLLTDITSTETDNESENFNNSPDSQTDEIIED